MRLLRGSTRMRILGWVLVPVLAALAISWVGAWTLLLQRVDARIDTELLGEVSELRLLAEQGVDEQTGAPYADVRSLLDQYIQRSIPDPNETMFTVVAGEVNSRSVDQVPVRLDLDDRLLAEVRDVSQVTFGDLPTAAGKVRWVAVPVTSNGQKGVFVTGIFSDLEGAEVAAVMGRFAAVAIATLALAAVLGWFVAGRLLSPLREMRQTARQISETDLTRRIPVENGNGDEVADLARTFNDMLDRLAEAFAGQQAFIDDVGHELRTPLTIVQGHLELLEEDPEQRAATIALVVDELARMGRLVHDLQTLTKSNQPGFVRPGPTDLGALLDEIVVKAHALGDRRWGLSVGEDATVDLDRQRITQAMLQLAQNAVQQTRAGDPIEIGGRIVGDQVVLSVADSGPGIAPEDRQRVLSRFTRGAGASAHTEGTGLGLALVSAIAAGHHGQVVIGDSALGGADVRMELPLHATAPVGADR